MDPKLLEVVTLMARSADAIARALHHHDSCQGRCWCGVKEAEHSTRKLWIAVEGLAKQNSFDVDSDAVL